MPSQDPALLRRLLRAKDRIDAASQEAWPVERLAHVSGLSEAHFARCFKEAFGVPPHRYLLTRRIDGAKALLRDTDAPIIEIAFQTGWNSLVLLSQTESPGRSILPRDSAHGRASSQDQGLSWETRMAVVARNALRPILLSWRACLATLGEVRQ